MNKTLIGGGPSSVIADDVPDVYGVRINNENFPLFDVHVKDLNVEQKHFGIIFEAVKEGSIENVKANYNHHGIYLWEGDSFSITGNFSEYNLGAGIVLDAYEGVINSDNVISNNVVSNNGESGISLWLECVNNTIHSNIANNNGTDGISLQNNANSNTLSSNIANSNPNGIYVYNSNTNSIFNNKLNENSNKGLWLLAANDNDIEENEITDNGDSGIWLNSSENNEVHGNTITLNQWWGIYLGGNNNNQKIYNNYFKNGDNAGSRNVGFDGLNSGNSWNIEKTVGENIVGGLFLGGNYWARSDGTGFSEVTEDGDGDCICDSAYTLASGHVDALPLHTSAVTELYVNQDITGSCGEKKPCYRTIQQAIDVAGSGATIKIASGTYNESFQLNTNKNIRIEGGWDFSIPTQTSASTIIKAPLTTAGAITFLNVIKIGP